MSSYNSSQYSLGFLINIETVDNNNYFYQNFQREEDFIYDDNIYQYLPIEYNPPTRNITMDSESTTVSLPCIPLILAIVVTNNYFKDASVLVTQLQYDFPTTPPINSDLQIISNYSFQESDDNSNIIFTLESPFNVITGKLPNLYYSTGYNNSAVNLIGYVPESPLFNRNS